MGRFWILKNGDGRKVTRVRMVTTGSSLFKEERIQETIANWFRQKGYFVVEKCVDDPLQVKDIRKCRTSTVFGIDIVAQKEGQIWIVEVKGETRGGTASGDVDFYSCLGQLLRHMKLFTPDVHYGIGIPNTPHFHPALLRIKGSKAIEVLGINLILVSDAGHVELLNPRQIEGFLTSLKPRRRGRPPKLR